MTIAPKRKLEIDPPTNFTNKRRYLSATPQIPASASPYPSRPSDSPSNPFGRKHTKTLTRSLPAPSHFSKHVSLRFQLVRTGAYPCLGGVDRVVQVPLSYTFTHLRCLIAFLFGSTGSNLYSPSDKHLFKVNRKVVMYSPTYKPGQIKSGQTWAKLSSARDPCRYRPESDEDTDELIGMYLSGEVKGEEGNNKEGSGEGDSGAEGDTEAEECEDWEWEPEEVFTLAHVWPRGRDLARGIIYQHTRNMSIHITINTSPIPRRKGTSNTPYVFSARGRVHLSPAPLPQPVLSVSPQDLRRASYTTHPSIDTRYRMFSPGTALGSALHVEAKQKERRREQTHAHIDQVDEDLTDADADGDTDPEHDYVEPRAEGRHHEPNAVEEEQEQEESGQEEDLTLNLSPDQWNAPDAFAAFLKRFGRAASLPSYISSSSSEDEEDAGQGPENVHGGSMGASISTPALTPSSSSSPAPPSSPPPFPSPPPQMYRHAYASSSSYKVLSSPSPRFACHHSNIRAYQYVHTPHPAHAPWQRRRIERVQRRMERMKRREWMCAADEAEDEDQDKRDKGEEKDELTEGESAEGGENEGAKWGALPGEVWDPFGDECEI